jgi:hypothetical protein
VYHVLVDSEKEKKMADLTVEIFPVCSTLEPYRKTWNVGGYEQHVDASYEINCSCKGFHFRHSCKHAKQVEAERCTWHGAYDEEIVEDGKCPRCGDDVMYVRVGV